MHELPYFKNYVDEYLTGDIRLCSYEVQGVFAILKCLFWKKGGYLTSDINELSRLSGIEKEVITNAIALLSKHGIICYNKDNLLYVKFILEQLDEMSLLSDKRARAGKAGMSQRWQNQRVKGDNKCYNKAITKLSTPVITKHNNIDQEEEEDKDINTPISPFISLGTWVRLTQDEYNRLERDLGKQHFADCLKYLDDYLVNNSKKRKQYKDHNRVIRNWVSTAVLENEAKRAKASATLGITFRGTEEKKPASPKPKPRIIKPEDAISPEDGAASVLAAIGGV